MGGTGDVALVSQRAVRVASFSCGCSNACPHSETGRSRSLSSYGILLTHKIVMHPEAPRVCLGMSLNAPLRG